MPKTGPPPPALPTLPETAQTIADVIGAELTLKLAAAARHRAVYVPKNMPSGHWITAIVGHEASAKLVKEFGGMLLTLARCSCVARQDRDRKIYRAHKAGMRRREIARVVGVSPETVRLRLKSLSEARVVDHE